MMRAHAATGTSAPSRTLAALVLSAMVSIVHAGAAVAGDGAGSEASGGAADARLDTSSQLTALLEASAAGGARVLTAQDVEYFDQLPSHTRRLIEDAVDEAWITVPDHLRALLALRLSPAKLETALQDNCVLCHTDPESQGEDTLLTWSAASEEVVGHMHLELFASDVHFRRGLSCAGCHGGDPDDDFGHDFVDGWPQSSKARREDRSWVPGFCGRCHSDSAFMRKFNPGLPTDQLSKYAQSRHGKLLLEGNDSRAAECTSCHGLHGIQGASSPRSMVYPSRVPGTCAACHADAEHMAGFTLPDGSPLPTDQFDRYREGVHGRALLERGDIGAPACNDCHGNHAAMPPEVASVSQICRNCHANNGTLFDGSRHKDVFEQHGWPECGMCHGNHGIAEPTDAMLAPGPDSLCSGCHEQYARDNPECAASAAFFHEEIKALVDAHAAGVLQVETLAHRGVDTDGIVAELEIVIDSLRTARSHVHAFERSEFAQASAPGLEAVARIETLAQEAEDELSYRFFGLLVAGLFIGATLLVLGLKLCELESG
jgi:predicted CXXCH cytochrome family protein